MKDEIKIITLGDIFENLETEEKAFKFKDYITNLQEENENNKKAINLFKDDLANMTYQFAKEKSRNEKAIEYINTWLVDEYSIAVPSKEEPDVFCEYEPNAIEKLLNILNGGDEE